MEDFVEDGCTFFGAGPAQQTGRGSMAVGLLFSRSATAACIKKDQHPPRSCHRDTFTGMCYACLTLTVSSVSVCLGVATSNPRVQLEKAWRGASDLLGLERKLLNGQAHLVARLNPLHPAACLSAS